MPRVTRTLRRLTRPALAVVLVFAQAVAAFGFPVVRSKGQSVRPCGCTVVCGTTPDCCCTKPPPPPHPSPPPCPRCAVAAEPQPEPPACPKCKAKEVAKSACGTCATTARPADGVTWVAAWKARQCRGEGPAGLLAELPAVPPVVPAAVRAFAAPTAFPPPADAGVPHFSTDPSDPPPRG